MKSTDSTSNEKILLKLISKEIEKRFECKVMHISFCSILGTPNIMCKIQYNDDFVYKPCEHWTPTTICFSERSVNFMRRVDFFDCMKDVVKLN